MRSFHLDVVEVLIELKPKVKVLHEKLKFSWGGGGGRGTFVGFESKV